MAINPFLLKDVSSTTTGDSNLNNSGSRTYQAIGNTASGTGAASIDIEVSNNGANWLLAGTITLTLGTTVTTDGFSSSSVPWVYSRAKLTSISGTGAVVSVIMGA